MKWFKVGIYILILFIYGHEQLRFSEIKYTNPNLAEITRVQNFLQKYNSPMVGNAQDFVVSGIRYKVNDRVLVAISGVESGLGKQIAQGSYNPFGYMCGQSVCYFNSFKEAIDQVARTISRDRTYKRYRETGQIYDLAVPYNYVHPTDWTQKVNWFMNQI